MPDYHKNLIKQSLFDDKFKSTLMDYYTYGFRNQGWYLEQKSETTILADWNRVCSIMRDYMEWSQDRNRVMYTSVDSVMMPENPFHRVYRFCNYIGFTNPAYFFTTIMALSRDFSLRKGMDVRAAEKYGIDLYSEVTQKRLETRRLKGSDLQYFYGNLAAKASSSENRQKTIGNKLGKSEEGGFLFCRRNDSEKGSDAKGDRRWDIDGLTLRDLLEGVPEEKRAAFADHLRSAIDFFSKSYVFGEVGTFLLARLGGQQESPFRVRQAYFAQALNDYNLIDLLVALEEGHWCLIHYRHATEEFVSDLLCFPLEIRVSAQGRMFLMYYEPFRRAVTALRLEFIDQISFCPEASVRALFEDPALSDALRQMECDTVPEDIGRDIAGARKVLGSAWGVSIPGSREEGKGNAAVPPEPVNVTFQVEYDPETESYIPAMLERECRFGQIDELEDGLLEFRASVADAGELRPWVRTFYNRLAGCTGMDTGSFTVETDIERMHDILSGRRVFDETVYPGGRTGRPVKRWNTDPRIVEALKNVKEASGHALLFNENFNLYYFILADVLVRICSREGQDLRRQEIQEMIAEAVERIGRGMQESLRESMLYEAEEFFFSVEGLFLTKKQTEVEVRRQGSTIFKETKTATVYEPRYRCAAGLDLYRDVIPLSTIELRWLVTILAQPRFAMFFDGDELEALKKLEALNRQEEPEKQEKQKKRKGSLDPEGSKRIRPLPVERIVYYDRARPKGTDPARESGPVRTLTSAIARGQVLHISYRTASGRTRKGEFEPLVIEFSMKDDTLRAAGRDRAQNRFVTMALENIETIEPTNERFDKKELLERWNASRKESLREIRIEFYHRMNLPDRLLTQLSPYKKRCSYDQEKDRYTLTLSYSRESDGKDLVATLMSFGPYILITPEDDPIRAEMEARVAEQRKLLHPDRQEEEEF